MAHKRKADEALAPTKVFMVTWNIASSIEELSDDAFADMRDEDQRRDRQEDLERELEMQEKGISQCAYSTAEKANVAAKAKFEELREKFFAPELRECDVKDGGEDEEDEHIHLSYNADGCIGWSWDFTKETSGLTAGGNIVLYEGSVGTTTIMVE